MSTSTNLGSQSIVWDYLQDAKGSEFTKLLHAIKEPGIYTGADMTINAGPNAIDISPFNIVIDGSTTQTIHALTEQIVTFSPGGGWPVSETIYIYMLFDWSDSVENWMSFNTRLTSSGSVAREVILGTVTTDGGGVLQTVSYNARKFGLNIHSADINKLMDAVADWDSTVNIGGGSADEPDNLVYSNGVFRLRQSYTYGAGVTAGMITVTTFDYSVDSGGAYSTLKTKTNSYDGSGNFTGSAWT